MKNNINKETVPSLISTVSDLKETHPITFLKSLLIYFGHIYLGCFSGKHVADFGSRVDFCQTHEQRN